MCIMRVANYIPPKKEGNAKEEKNLHTKKFIHVKNKIINAGTRAFVNFLYISFCGGVLGAYKHTH